MATRWVRRRGDALADWHMLPKTTILPNTAPVVTKPAPKRR